MNAQTTLEFPVSRPLPERPVSLGARHLQVLSALVYLDVQGDGVTAAGIVERLHRIGDPYEAGPTRSRLAQLERKGMAVSVKPATGPKVWLATFEGREAVR